MRTSFPGSRSGTVRRLLPSILALTVLCATPSNAYGGWFTDWLASLFGGGGNGGGSGGNSTNLVNGGAPVPTIVNDVASANFFLQHMVDAAEENGEEAENPNEKYAPYSVKLTLVISQLSPEEQRIVFYGQ